MAVKRKFTTGRGKSVYGRKVSYASRAKRAKTSGRVGYANIVRIGRQVGNLTRMIETKTAQWTSPANVNMPHNNTYVVQMAGGGGDLNPVRCTNGTDDPMGGNTGSRIGDRITIKGLAIRGMVECSLQRPKVHFRIMLVKCPRGQAPTRDNGLFMGCSGNKMIDTVNTEKFTILWQTRFNVTCSNLAAATASIAGTGLVLTGTPAGIGNKTFSAWIPGKKFGRGGNINYENTSSINPKFFDYRIVFLSYDWYGTLQDVNNVGLLNELYTKLYFKDA